MEATVVDLRYHMNDIEQYSLSHGLEAGDAIIAATAAENNQTLCSGNAKHFSPIRDLALRIFKP